MKRPERMERAGDGAQLWVISAAGGLLQAAEIAELWVDDLPGRCRLCARLSGGGAGRDDTSDAGGDAPGGRRVLDEVDKPGSGRVDRRGVVAEVARQLYRLRARAGVLGFRVVLSSRPVEQTPDGWLDVDDATEARVVADFAPFVTGSDSDG